MSDEALPVLFSFGGVDGGPRVEITVSGDAMSAWGTFFPATEPRGKLIVWPDLEEALRNAGFREGLLTHEIQEVLFRFNTGHPPAERVLIARGRPPQAERPAFLKLEPRFFAPHFQDLGGAQVDFKEYSPFIIVKKGELLARAILPRTGVPGTTVYGTEIPAGKKDIKHIKPGTHTLFAHGKVFSRIAGRFTLEGDVFDVSDVLELDGGVGYGTGNLIFPGSVVVKGVVADGFRLVAGAGITVKGPLDASEVMCNGDLVCDGGIIGKKPGVVRVGGALKARYVEHCLVEVLGPILVNKALLHARVATNGDLTMEDAGRIVAATVWVKGNLSCGQLGGESGPVRVVAGSDFVVQRKMDGIRSRYHHLEDEVQKEKVRGVEPSSEKLAALASLVGEMNSLTPQLFCNPATEVRIAGKIVEGTVIEMGYATLTVSQPMKGQVFRLSPDGKTVTAMPLSKDQAPPEPSAPVAEGLEE